MTFSPSLRSGNSGFTLLEVLASLALLALLLTGIYAGIRTATQSVRKGEASIEQLDRLRSAQQFLRRELMQAQEIPWTLDDQRKPVVFEGTARAMSYIAPMPGYLGKLGPQLQSLRLVADEHGRLRLEASFATVPADGSKPRPPGSPEVLLTGISRGRFGYFQRGDQAHPGAWSSTWSAPAELPVMVRVELTMADGSLAWPGVEVPIRQSPGANNVRSLALPLLYGKGP